MHEALIYRIVEELQTNLTGRYFGKIFQLTPLSFAFDFGLRGQFLLVSVDPASPRLYLIQRRLRDIEKQSVPLAVFGQVMRTKLGGAHLVNIAQDHADRIVRFTFRIDDEMQGALFRRLVVQLTGRTADLFLLDELNRITAVLREHDETRLNQTYQPPPPRSQKQTRESLTIGPGSPSQQLDAHFSALDAARVFDSKAKNIRAKLMKSIRQQQTLSEHLQEDLRRHGNPDEHKKSGDLLLANIGTAVRNGNRVRITDYYAEDAPLIELEIDENRSLQDEATHRFRQYTKAKRATEEIATRLKQIELDTHALEARLQQLAAIITARDEAALEGFEKPRPAPKVTPKKTSKQEKIPGARRYLSTDGYEILVGRAARDNDHLTFRVAQPNDLWMHAGDYPGSHVIVRNPTRKEIPQRTVIEAAQLAGKFSQASEDTKVVIHYTERKFLTKPKGAAPGLVRMSRFKSITVAPKEAVPRL
jgi:predicted ribosome quality control (RQC) complex YloA/Tae2 family protein